VKLEVYPNLTLTNRFLPKKNGVSDPPPTQKKLNPEKNYLDYSQVEYLNFKNADPQDPSLKKRPSYKNIKTIFV